VLLQVDEERSMRKERRNVFKQNEEEYGGIMSLLTTKGLPATILS
jgi:hypothetical protein